MRGRKFDCTTLKFEYFVVESATEERSKAGSVIWLCKCICGNTFRSHTNVLRKRERKSCGCKSYILDKPRIARSDPKEVSFKCCFNHYRSGAKRREISFSLTYSQFKMFLQSKCFYCGVEPRRKYNRFVTKTGKITHKDLVHVDKSWILINGVDRIDSMKGYIPENCVSACQTCNYAKAELSVEGFQQWLARIAAYQLLPLPPSLPREM